MEDTMLEFRVIDILSLPQAIFGVSESAEKYRCVPGISSSPDVRIVILADLAFWLHLYPILTIPFFSRYQPYE